MTHFPQDPTHDEVQAALRSARWPAFKIDTGRYIDDVLNPTIENEPVGDRKFILIAIREGLEGVIGDGTLGSPSPGTAAAYDIEAEATEVEESAGELTEG